MKLNKDRIVGVCLMAVFSLGSQYWTQNAVGACPNGCVTGVKEFCVSATESFRYGVTIAVILNDPASNANQNPGGAGAACTQSHFTGCTTCPCGGARVRLFVPGNAYGRDGHERSAGYVSKCM